MFALPALPALLGGTAVGGTAAAAGTAAAVGAGTAATAAGTAAGVMATHAATFGLTGATAATMSAGSALSMGSIFTGLSTIGSIFSGIQGYVGAQSQANALEASQRLSTMSTSLDIKRSLTTKELERAERERRLSAKLAEYRASVGGKVELDNLGTPAVLQNALIGSVNRQNRYDDLFTNTDIASLKINDANNRIGTAAEVDAAKMAGFSGLLDTGMGVVDTLNKGKDLA